jgi:alkylated DNA repair dioxygenase AlkB
VLHETVFDEDSSAGMLRALLDEVPWQTWSISMFGRDVIEPRLSAWVGDPGTAYRYSRRTREPMPWTPTLDDVRRSCETIAGARFNAVLANLYRDGDDSMGWHSDDEPENGPDPVIASVSFGEARRFDFRHRTTGERAEVWLPSGSVLVMSGPCQRHWQHRIAKSARVRGPRVNLTYRLVNPG